MIASAAARDFDLAFADTCLGGSTVAARVARSAAGLRAYYLADYAVNPLGIKSRAEVRIALERWIGVAAARAGTLVVACNTASVLLEQLPDLAACAAAADLRVVSMVHLLDRALSASGSSIQGKRVCVMGTRFTVTQPVYPDRLWRAGAAEVLPLAATQTERAIAHLWHTTPEGRRQITEEAADTVCRADVTVLACTLFPLVASLLREVNPQCVFVDPAAGVEGLLHGSPEGGANRMTIAMTGDAIALEDVRARSALLFPGWVVESVERASVEDTRTFV